MKERANNAADREARMPFLSVHLPLLAVQLLFATLPPLAKIAFDNFSPKFVVLLRISVSSVLFYLVFRLFFYEKLQSKVHLFHFALLGLFGVSGNQFLFLSGLEKTTASNAVILISSIPIFTLIVAVSLRKERLTLVKTLGVLLSLSGAGYILGFSGLQFSDYFSGNILILAGAMCYAIYLVVAKPVLRIYNSVTVITYVFIFGFIEVLPFVVSEIPKVIENPTPPALWLAPSAVILFGTFLPYLLNAVALKTEKSSLVAVYIYLQPFLGVLLAMVMIGESPAPNVVFAGLVILAGVSVVSFEKHIARLRRQRPIPDAK